MDTIDNHDQKKHHFSYSILIDSTLEQAWTSLAEVSTWHVWDTELEAPNSYSFVTDLPVGTLVIKRTLSTHGNQVKFTDDIKFTGFLKQLFGLMLGSAFKAVLPEVMNNFKVLVEKSKQTKITAK